MPYVRQREVPFVSVRRLLLGYELDAAALAKILECTPKTARARLANPGTFTLAELERVNRAGRVPMEEIRSAIRR